MPSIFFEDNEFNIDKVKKGVSPPLFTTGPPSSYIFDQQQRQHQLIHHDWAAEFAKISLGCSSDHNSSANYMPNGVSRHGDGLNSGGESRSSCSETDYTALNEPTALELLHIAAAAAAHRKSQNTTECVPVPSSEHVAEIVGRQGCKIKALRAKTNTYIKTPVRGEDSVFVVTGRKEDVAAAKQEILSAAEHFTQIRASRRHSQGGIPAPGHITAYVRVPYKFVGLVVGPKGATIKRIQQQTHTYIVTPSRDKEPVFEVTGLSDNVEAARREIETHIGSRTGHLLPPTAYLDNSYNGCNVSNVVDYDSTNNFGCVFNNQSSLSNGGGSQSVAVVLNDFHLNGTDTSSNGTTGSSGDSSVVSSLGSHHSGASFGGAGGGVITCKPPPPYVASNIVPPSTFLSSYPCSNESFNANLINSQVQIGYNGWTINTVNPNPCTATNNDNYLLANGAKSFHSLLNNLNNKSTSKCGSLADQDGSRPWLSSNGCTSCSPKHNQSLAALENQQSLVGPPCTLLPSFLSSIWSSDSSDNHEDLTPIVQQQKQRSASLGVAAANEGDYQTTMLGLKLVA